MTIKTAVLSRAIVSAVGAIVFALTANFARAQAPLITVPPQSQTSLAGSTVTFAVGVSNGVFTASLPTVSSGTLRMWLKADAGVITNSDGQVLRWQDQSGNGNDAFAPSPAVQPTLVTPTELGGSSAIRFDGIQDNVNGDYLQGTNDVGIPDAYTSFTVYNIFQTTNTENVMSVIGHPGREYGECRINGIAVQNMSYSGWADDYQTQFTVPTNTYRIWTDRVDTNLSQVEIFDTTAASNTNFQFSTSQFSPPAPGFFIGGLDPSWQFVTKGRNFNGDVAELIYFRGQLTDADRLAVEQYLKGKYLGASTDGLTFQWRFNGVNITDATNSILTLTNVQAANAGSYDVVVCSTNLVDCTTSSAATLGVSECLAPPAGLISWWPGDGGTADIAGTNHGTFVSGSSYVAGEVGQAFKFDGFSSYISIPDSESLRPASVTLSGWFEFDGGSGVQNLVTKTAGTGTSESYILALIYGSVVGGVGDPTSVGDTISYPLNPVAGVWYHLAYTFDSVTMQQALYINGDLIAAGAASKPIGYDAHPVMIGAEYENEEVSYFQQGAADEVTIFGRALSDSEIQSMYDVRWLGMCKPLAIVSQPESVTLPVGGAGSLNVAAISKTSLAYQWYKDGLLLPPGTNATLSLTNVQSTDSGSYYAVATDLSGAVTSVVATVTVMDSPSISVPPQSQRVLVGTNVTFTVTAEGSAPLSYQWLLNGIAIADATNSVLSLSNVQLGNAGFYSVVVTNAVGTATSSPAALSIDVVPTIYNQPQSQTVFVDGTAMFSVFPNPVLPNISSGTLRLWLTADAGVVTNANGVAQWQDQSGNTNDANAPTAATEPSIVYPLALGSRPAIRFDGIRDNVNGDYLYGQGDVGIPDAYTAFTVYNALQTTNNENIMSAVGHIGREYGECRIDGIAAQDMAYSGWANDHSTPFTIPTNTYRIWTDRMDTNLSQVELFDTTATSNTNFVFSLSQFSPPVPGYFIGGLDPSWQYVVSGRNFNGDIAEMIFYRGQLTETDRLAVEQYLKAKYLQAGEAQGYTYQWQLNGVDIPGATNSTLTVTNAQSGDVGSYDVVICNASACTTSSIVVLTEVLPSLTITQDGLGNVTLLWPAAATGYVLESVSDLSASWQPVPGTVVTNGANVFVTQPASTNQLYFRLHHP